MRMLELCCYQFSFYFVLFFSLPAAAIPDRCLELVPLADGVSECGDEHVSWQALPHDVTPVCSGAWEYTVYDTCTIEDPACGPANCERYLYYTTWKNEK